MEVGPTCHYVMGGIEVDPDTGAAATPGLFAAGECAGGMHGFPTASAVTRCPTCWCSGRRAGLGASDYVRAMSDRPAVTQDAVDTAKDMALAVFDGPSDGSSPENPYTLQLDMQDTMNNLVGIIRKADEMQEALDKLQELRDRYKRVRVEGERKFNPGWHLAMDLRNMLLVSESVAKSAMTRTESRGGHTRDDFPTMDASLAQPPSGVPLRGRRPGGPGRRRLQGASAHDADRSAGDVRALRAREVLHRRRTPRTPATEGLSHMGAYNAKMRVWRGDASGGELKDYTVEVNEGEVVLDIIQPVAADPDR